METRLDTGGNVAVRWALPGFAANWRKPTVAEINATLDVTESVSLSNFSFGNQASNQISDPAMSDRGNAQTRGFPQFGGDISFFYPAKYNDATNPHSNTFDAFDESDDIGYVLMRIDGAVTPVDDFDAKTGDFWHVYKVVADGWSDEVVGENAFKYTVTFLPQGDIATNVYVGATVAITATVVGGPALTVGDKAATIAYITGRQVSTLGYSGAFRWTTSDPTKATVDRNGVVRAIAAGAVTITPTWPHTGTAGTAIALTVT